MTRARDAVEVIARELVKLDGKNPDFLMWLPSGRDCPLWEAYLPKARKIKQALSRNHRRQGHAIKTKRTA